MQTAPEVRSWNDKTYNAIIENTNLGFLANELVATFQVRARSNSLQLCALNQIFGKTKDHPFAEQNMPSNNQFRAKMSANDIPSRFTQLFFFSPTA